MNKTIYDVIIIGAGAAGMSAGIYSGRAKMKTLVLEQGSAGGQAKQQMKSSTTQGYVIQQDQS